MWSDVKTKTWTNVLNRTWNQIKRKNFIRSDKMAVYNVKVNLNGQNYDLSYNGTSGKWESTITALV